MPDSETSAPLSAVSCGDNIPHERVNPELDIHPLLGQRRSLRAFSPRPVEPQTLRALLEAARRAPSSMNQQPWNFIVAAKQNRTEFYRLLGCLLDFNVVWAQHAPVLLLSIAKLIFTANGEPNRHSFYDVGHAMASLTFQANACGLTVCQMAGFDASKARETFAIPENHEPVTVAAIGYPGDPSSLPDKLQQKQAARQVRRPLEEFVFQGSWGQPAGWARDQSA